MDKLEYVKNKNGVLLSIIIRSNYVIKKSHFITDEDVLQNVGFFNYKKGSTVKPHYHPKIKRTILGTPEVVIIKTGKLKLIIYDDDQEHIGEFTLNQNDMFLLINGGHAEEFLSDVSLLVIKQGPYDPQKDKVVFGEKTK